MNFNNILVGITLLISLITLYTIYNVNNNMDKLLLDTDSDDPEAATQILSIIKYTKENNLASRTIIKNQMDINNDIYNMRDNVKVFEGRRRKDAEVQYSLLERIAKELRGVPAMPMSMMAAAPSSGKYFLK